MSNENPETRELASVVKNPDVEFMAEVFKGVTPLVELWKQAEVAKAEASAEIERVRAESTARIERDRAESTARMEAERAKEQAAIQRFVLHRMFWIVAVAGVFVAAIAALMVWKGQTDAAMKLLTTAGGGAALFFIGRSSKKDAA